MGELHIQRDQELFNRIAESDAAAFTEFFNCYSSKLASYISRFFNSDIWAEEIVQDVFLKLWTIRGTLHNMEYPAAFVYRMTANRAKDLLKSQQHQVKLQYYLSLHSSNNIASNDPQTLYDYRNMDRLFQLAIQQLPPKRAAIFKMRHEKGLSYEEIATALQLSKNTVRAQLNFLLKN